MWAVHRKHKRCGASPSSGPIQRKSGYRTCVRAVSRWASWGRHHVPTPTLNTVLQADLLSLVLMCEALVEKLGAVPGSAAQAVRCTARGNCFWGGLHCTTPSGVSEDRRCLASDRRTCCINGGSGVSDVNGGEAVEHGLHGAGYKAMQHVASTPCINTSVIVQRHVYTRNSCGCFRHSSWRGPPCSKLQEATCQPSILQGAQHASSRFQ